MTRFLIRFFLVVSFFVISCGFAEGTDPLTVYLTWQRSPESTMTVQWISDLDSSDDLVEYQKEGESIWYYTRGRHMRMPEKFPYYIHVVELMNLSPDTIYLFRTNRSPTVYKFKTMPVHLDTSIRFVVGGDVYHDGIDLVHATNRQAAKTDPMFALIGGDIAYAAGKRFGFLPAFMHPWLDALTSQKVDRWLMWLIAWKNDMVTSDGRLIPFVPAIGNHDTNGRFHQSPQRAPFFYSLFAMPGIQGYNVLDFGDYMSVFILDSGHTHPISGNQKLWLSRALEMRQTFPHKFAIYHVPAYPSVRDFNNEISPQIRRSWVPLFEKYQLTAAFENHDHCYKRTHPLLQGKIDPQGVLYIGDGAWGIEKPRRSKPSADKWYLAKTVSQRHFILVTIKESSRRFQAVTPSGVVIDDKEWPLQR